MSYVGTLPDDMSIDGSVASEEPASPKPPGARRRLLGARRGMAPALGA